MKDKQAAQPWLPMDAAWWVEIANTIPRPWPREAVYMDLRWWDDQEAQGRAKRPGRAALCQRWGWTDRTARNAMKDGEKWERSSQSPARVPTRGITEYKTKHKTD